MTTRLTEATLRRIVREETQKLTQGERGLKESVGPFPLPPRRPGADEALANAMMEWVNDWMSDSGEEDPQLACDALQREVEGFCEEFKTSY